MKLKDYMVGDLIATEHGFPMQVVSVGTDYLYADFEGNEGDVFEFYEKYMPKPIPLTPEILEKNGWVNKKEKGWMQKGNFGNSPLMLWYIKDTGKFNPHFAYELEMSDLSKDGGFRIKVQCIFVHTLQHVLRLCGLDELADNFKV